MLGNERTRPSSWKPNTTGFSENAQLHITEAHNLNFHFNEKIIGTHCIDINISDVTELTPCHFSGYSVYTGLSFISMQGYIGKTLLQYTNTFGL
jgi:hypothetical protein